MLFLSEIIVYIWLLPVAIHILLPLAILAAWSAIRLLPGKGSRESIAKKTVVSP